MIEAVAARDLVEQLRRVEDRLVRLLESGWRQAHAEAADLRADADALTEAGLTQVAARVVAVAEAGSAAEALPAIALAMSACRLLRLRLQADAVPEGWAPPAVPTRRARTGTETLLPVSRLLLDGREVWACVQAARNRCVLLEPPFPVEEPPAEAAPPAPAGGFLGRLTRRLGLASEPTLPPSRWLNERLRGRLRWRARYPVGAEGDLPLCELHDPEWVAVDDEHPALLNFHRRLAANTLQDGMSLSWQVASLRLADLKRADPATFVWLDPSGSALLAGALDMTFWSLAWVDGAVIVPLGFLVPSAGSRQPRIVHLLPGAPSEVLWKPA